MFAKLKVDSITDWKRAVRSIPEKEYGRLEWQAYCYAGHLLVPTHALRVSLKDCADRVGGEGLDIGDEAVRFAVEKYLGDTFSVSSAVIHKRIEIQGLY